MFEHLRQNNTDYFRHFVTAVIFSVLSIVAGVIFLIHAFLPFVLTTTGSDLIRKIHSRFPNK